MSIEWTDVEKGAVVNKKHPSPEEMMSATLQHGDEEETTFAGTEDDEESGDDPKNDAVKTKCENTKTCLVSFLFAIGLLVGFFFGIHFLTYSINYLLSKAQGA